MFPTALRCSEKTAARAVASTQTQRQSLKASASLSSQTLSESRSIHSSASRNAKDASLSDSVQRAKIVTSSWSRPPKPSQDAYDNIVPSYYIERKRQRDSISERKEEEGGLMAELSAGILSDGVAAQTKVLPEKIPVEVREADGTVRHPSGFEPPTPETKFHPVASKHATVDNPLLTTVKLTWDEALAPGAHPSISGHSSTMHAGSRGSRA
ncbi:hypothetical protein C8Q75DRAFT_732439 [Abortiporus biennis]|nr:hypothetical protein C8Q75DRAFT_732439 [Abortiporus biennis]